MIECKNCKQPLKDDEQVYQLRLGHWSGRPALVIKGEFEPDEDVEYWHVDCPIPHCDHNRTNHLVPSRADVVESFVYKKEVVEPGSQMPQYRAKYDWRVTDYQELGLKVSYVNKDNINDTYDELYAFVKCATCGVIESV